MIPLWLYWRARERAAYWAGVRAAWVFIDRPFNELVPLDELPREMRNSQCTAFHRIADGHLRYCVRRGEHWGRHEDATGVKWR